MSWCGRRAKPGSRLAPSPKMRSVTNPAPTMCRSASTGTSVPLPPDPATAATASVIASSPSHAVSVMPCHCAWSLYHRRRSPGTARRAANTRTPITNRHSPAARSAKPAARMCASPAQSPATRASTPNSRSARPSRSSRWSACLAGYPGDRSHALAALGDRLADHAHGSLAHLGRVAALECTV